MTFQFEMQWIPFLQKGVSLDTKLTPNGQNCFRLRNEVISEYKVFGLHITAPFWQQRDEKYGAIIISRLNLSQNMERYRI